MRICCSIMCLSFIASSFKMFAQAPTPTPFRIHNLDGALVDRDYFNKMMSGYFTYVAGAAESSMPGVSNVSVDLIGAKYNVGGSVLYKNFFANLTATGEYEGNIAKLVTNTKAGSNFGARLNIGLLFYSKSYFQSKYKSIIEYQIRKTEAEYLKNYADIICEKDSSILKNNDCISKINFVAGCENSLDVINAGLKYEQKYRIDTLLKALDKKREAIYQQAEWSAIRLMWFNVIGGVNGAKVYQSLRKIENRDTTYFVDPSLSLQQRDSIRRSVEDSTKAVAKNFITGYFALQGNFYHYSRNRNFTFYGNAGIGLDFATNMDTLDKGKVTDERINKLNAVTTRKSADTYDVFIGEITRINSFWFYLNAYLLVGKQQATGFHIGYDLKRNLSSEQVKSIVTRHAITLGIIINGTKKGESKVLVTVMPYFKTTIVEQGGNRTDASLNLTNNRNTEFGLQFNVPIRSVIWSRY